MDEELNFLNKKIEYKLKKAKIKLYILLLAKHPNDLTDVDICLMGDLANDEDIQQELSKKCTFISP